VTVYNKPTVLIASLYTIGGIMGVVFQPALGHLIDRFGERVMLTVEGVMLVAVCLGYGFSRILFGEAGFVIASVCYVVDMLLFSFGMARATYLKKIAKDPRHVSPTLTMGTTIDHVFSIGIALASGVIWSVFGYQYVFIIGALIAAAYAVAAFRIVLPMKADAG
jgi:MFS family permease